MADGSHTMYPGADNLLNGYNSDSLFTGYRIPSGSFGFPSNPQTANQIKAVSDKINTGTRTVEVSGVSISGGGPMDLIDNIPRQHLKEINRMKQLAGVDLTFHGPLVEATGLTGQQWDESQRKFAERQIISAVERGHELDPKGNIVITFHASNGLPEPETTIKTKEGEKTTGMYVIDERAGQIGTMPKMAPNFLEQQKETNPKEYLKEVNKKRWVSELSDVSLEVSRAQEFISDARTSEKKISQIIEEKKLPTVEVYKIAKESPEEYQKLLSDLEKVNPDMKYIANALVGRMTYGQAFIQKSYTDLQNLYNLAYQSAQKNGSDGKDTLKKLESYRTEIEPMIKEFKEGKNDPEKLSKYADEILRGVQILQGLKNPPSQYIPLREFAIDKAAETFGNAAFESYKQFGYKKKENTAPIISIENPPAGSGLNRAEELKALVEKARENFVQKAQDELKISEKEAQTQAEKLIGVTWDVGHINMIRKYGYDSKDLIKQTEKIAPFVKHIHLSDNFGMEHTELPMGMGNVPIKEQEEILKKRFGDKFKEIKQIVET